jgi:hypothetical protein
VACRINSCRSLSCLLLSSLVLSLCLLASSHKRANFRDCRNIPIPIHKPSCIHSYRLFSIRQIWHSFHHHPHFASSGDTLTFDDDNDEKLELQPPFSHTFFILLERCVSALYGNYFLSHMCVCVCIERKASEDYLSLGNVWALEKFTYAVCPHVSQVSTNSTGFGFFAACLLKGTLLTLDC